MTKILAFVDESPSRAAVTKTAQSLAGLLGASVEIVTIVDSASGTASDGVAHALLGRIKQDQPALAVLGARSIRAKPEPLGHIAMEVLTNCSIPLVLVPPASDGLETNNLKFLLPLDADPDTDDAIMPLATDLAEAGAIIISLHVFRSHSLPQFISHSSDLDILAEEFLELHLPGCSTRCELRVGDPAKQIIEIVNSEDLDGVLLAWGRDFSPGRAEVIRRLLGEASVPLLIVPIVSDEFTRE